MSFGTSCKVDLYFSHKTYKNKFEVEEDLEEVRNEIKLIETKIAMYAISDPRMALSTKDCAGAEMNPVDVLYNELDNLREWYKNSIIHEWELEMLLDNWESRTGDFLDEDKLRAELNNIK